jgi:hypothetical protein
LQDIGNKCLPAEADQTYYVQLGGLFGDRSTITSAST